MRRRDVGLSIAAGVVLVLLALLNPTGIGGLIVQYIAATAFNFWYVGAALIVAAVALRMANRWPALVRILGLVGITWITFVVTAIALLFVLLATSGPLGP